MRTSMQAGSHTSSDPVLLLPQDGFPTPLARQNRFQRHGTLLLYLNDVNEVCCAAAGCTCMSFVDHLGWYHALIKITN